MTDTGRLDWLERPEGSLAVLMDDRLVATGFGCHTHLTGWVGGSNLRDAIDKCRSALEDPEAAMPGDQAA